LALTGRRSKAGGKSSRRPANQSAERSTSGRAGIGWPFGASSFQGCQPVAGSKRWMAPRLRVLGGEDDPAVADQFLQGWLPLVDRADDFQVCSTITSSRIGSCTSTICSGRPVRRSELAPCITPNRPARLCVDLAATAVAFVVDRRKVVLEIDSGTDRTGRQQRRFKHAAIGVGSGS
jgi:hypothetical protein